jgi:uncharacterized coiled-coil DUF342 family protein
MMKQLDEMWAQARKVMAGKNDQLVNELNAMADSKSAAVVTFNEAMKRSADLRQQADKIQAEAVRAFDSELTRITAIILSLKSQLEDGELHSNGEPEPVKRLIDIVKRPNGAAA